MPVATFTVDGVPSALVTARLAGEDAIEVGHGSLHARPYLTRLLGLSPAGARAGRGSVRNSDRGAVPGAVRASAGINTSERDVARLLSAMERLVTGKPPVQYRRDRSPGISTRPGPRRAGQPLTPAPRNARQACRRPYGPAGDAAIST